MDQPLSLREVAMAKRGQCRCGTIIRFALTPRGYKARCSVCRSVVRLRVGRKDRPGKNRLARAPVAAPPPLPARGAPPALIGPEKHTKPVAPEPAETGVPHELESPPGGAPWWVLALIFAAVAALGVAAALLWEWGL
jgi:hypothetical protein